MVNRNKNSYLLLDAGCGKRSSIICPIDNAELVGVDILRTNVAVCRKQWRNRSYVVADLTMLPFIKGAFGGAMSADVLEHIDDKTMAINELARITRSGGFFIGSSTNILNPVLWLDAKFPMLLKPLEKKLSEPGHYDRHSRFSPSSLTKTLNSTGYRINYLYLLGYPQFSLTKPTSSGLALLWIVFDKLTKKKILVYFKEILIWQATRL
jgi:SAM-dependent methyltransferase